MQYIKDVLNECGSECGNRVSDAEFVRLLTDMQWFSNIKPMLMSKCCATHSEMELLFHALDYAAENGENITVAKAAKAMNVSAPAISRTLKALSSRGLTRREYDEHDRRSIRIVVTETGEAMSREFLRFAFTMLNNIMSEFSDEEMSQMITLYEHFTRAIIRFMSSENPERE